MKCDIAIWNNLSAGICNIMKKTISFFGKNIKMGDSVLETYVAMDNIIGDVLERIEKGVLPEDTVLMVVSDHGFGPFYYSMGVNNFLIEKEFKCCFCWG